MAAQIHLLSKHYSWNLYIKKWKAQAYNVASEILFGEFSKVNPASSEASQKIQHKVIRMV